jgi:hypothetical protein
MECPVGGLEVVKIDGKAVALLSMGTSPEWWRVVAIRPRGVFENVGQLRRMELGGRVTGFEVVSGEQQGAIMETAAEAVAAILGRRER